ncbi:MAG: ROK family transcriptional regulator [Anaerolineae bacterium]|nr:ROK family transcriptional regulator [Candidatus Roseilinea sp.]MDW8451305.1 ROK family transcriptional regulator [Anaerolineae bacterium]
MSKPTFAGSNASLVRAHNLRAVLNHFLNEGSVSRAQLAERTALSNTTITNLIDDLLTQGIVVEDDTETARARASSDGSRRVGRPRTGLRLNPNARYAAGVHIGIGILRVAVVNLHAEIIQNTIANFDVAAPAEHVLNQIARLVKQTIAGSRIETDRLIGLGIGASGLVDYGTGVNVFAPNLGWRDVPLRDWMQDRLGLPTAVDNNVRAMALGEALFGAGRNVGVLAFVYGRVGVGAGFVVNGRAFRGSGAGAGEIGHTVMIPDGGDLCGCGQRGCLETLVSEPVIVREAERLARRRPHSALARCLAQNGQTKPIERIFAAAREGDAATLRLLEGRARYLGIALANLVNVLNPELILLGGMFAQGSEFFLPMAERTMRERAFAGLGDRVRVQPTQFGWRAGVIGAASLALSTFFYQLEDA